MQYLHSYLILIHVCYRPVLLVRASLTRFSVFQCDPALLPEPNHVMLNHLYALSIKVRYTPCATKQSLSDGNNWLIGCFLSQDGVMVLSATQRYKKKYVTSLLYKPI